MIIPTNTLPQRLQGRLGIKEWDLIGDINYNFAPVDYRQRYPARFRWFRQEIMEPGTVLNLGCGHGRETFALCELYPSAQCTGIDRNESRIHAANRLVRNAIEFSGTVSDLYEQIKTIGPMTQFFPWEEPPDMTAERAELRAQLQAWERQLPSWLRGESLPAFVTADASDGLPFSDSSFNLAYARYVLHLFEDEEDVQIAGRNIARILGREGRFVLVEPTEKDGIRRDYAELLGQDIGFTLVATVEDDPDQLGGYDTRGSEQEDESMKHLVGYIFATV